MLNTLSYYILSAVATLIILTVHEYAHGYAAYRLGDNTALLMGRLTLNPIRHLDPIGAVCMLLFHFGWAKPVPINMRNFKNPRRDFAICALAGPLSNLLLAFFSAFLYLLLGRIFGRMEFSSTLLGYITSNLLLFIYIFHIINVGFGIFNLIPIPPLDGSRILSLLLPPRAYYTLLQAERKIYFVFLGWMLLGPAVSRFLLSVQFIAGNPVLSFIAGLFSLSDMLGYVFSFISRAMMSLWQLIPFLR